jgi:hypothetical protein
MSSQDKLQENMMKTCQSIKILFHNIQAENQSYKQVNPIRLFRIMSVSIMFRLFRVMASEMLGRLLLVFKLLL